MENLLTVIIQTSPLPSHPSTALLEALFRSFDRVQHLKECNIIILCDGCDDESKNNNNKTFEQTTTTSTTTTTTSNKTNYKHGKVSQSTAEKYHQHLQLLQEKIKNQEEPFCSQQNGSIQLFQLPYRHGSARAIAALFETNIITTPYILIGQHDNFFVKDIQYLRPLLNYMERQSSSSSSSSTRTWLQCVHFPSTATLNYIEKVQRRYQLNLKQYCKKVAFNDDDDENIAGEFIPLVFWYGRTHLARTSYYKKTTVSSSSSSSTSSSTINILGEFTLKAKDHLEELWGTKQLREIMELKKKSSTPTCNNSNDNNDKGAVVGLNGFEEVHAKYGNYVFFENGSMEEQQQQQEVLYHLSGRKVVAAATATATDSNDTNNNNDETSFNNNNKTRSEKTNSKTTTTMTTFQPHGKSFTQARRAIAVVPGLEIIATTQNNNNQTKQKSRFRQNCFHCGEKGHSFKFCPDLLKNTEECMPKMTVLDLS